MSFSKNNVSQKIPNSEKIEVSKNIFSQKKLFQKLSKKFENFGIFKFGKNKYSGIKKFLTSDQFFFGRNSFSRFWDLKQGPGKCSSCNVEAWAVTQSSCAAHHDGLNH